MFRGEKQIWMKPFLDEIVNCFGRKCFWMKVFLDESVFGRKCFWTKVFSLQIG